MQKTTQGESLANVPQVSPKEQEGTHPERQREVLKGNAAKVDDTVTKGEEKGAVVEAKIEPPTKQTEKLYDIKSLTTNLTPKKVMKLFLLLLMILLIVGALYAKFIRKTPMRTTNILINAPTPTYSPYQKYKPSIYATDANFKKIDEGINVLGNEVKNTTLEEQTLLPPSLDFDVELK